MSILDRVTWLVCILAAPVIFGFSTARAGDSLIDYHGFTLYHGRSDNTSIGPSPGDDYQWTSLGYHLGKHLAPWVSLETRIGAGYLETENFGDTPTLEARLLMDIHHKVFFFRIGGGVAHLFDDANLPGLAESPVHSIITGSAGLRFRFLRKGRPIELSLGYGVEHLSAPFKDGDDGDDGWNTGGLVIALTRPL